MRCRGARLSAVLGMGLVGALIAVPGFTAGFSIFEQGTKAMGMAGAFTAQADDPSAMYYNVGGLAFLGEREFYLGATYITNSESSFVGADPFPGAGVEEELKPLSAIVPHFYWVEPVSDKLSFGLAVNAPFGLVTEWENKDTFTGRFISTKAELTLVDFNPNLGIKVSEKFGIGVGAIVRLSSIELNQRVPAINPFTGVPVDIASSVLESDREIGLGWQVGFLHKTTDKFSWGFSYRSKVTIDYGGDALFTQISTGNPQLDAIVRSQLPFDAELPLSTSIEFPDAASLGLAYGFTQNLLVELDVNWTGWSSFDTLVIDFNTAAIPDAVRPQNWDDSYHYRLGVRWDSGQRSQWRFGYVYDETPQPDEGVGPLLPDANRNGFSVGYGRTGGKFGWDLAMMYLPFEDRTTSTNLDGFNGTYSITGWLFGGSISF